MPKRLLIVESDDSLTSVAYGFLDEAQWTIETKAEPHKVLEEIGDDPPDVLICAADLGLSTGYDLANKLRDITGLKKFPIILAASQPDNELLSIISEAYPLMVPFDSAQLSEVLAKSDGGGAAAKVSDDPTAFSDADFDSAFHGIIVKPEPAPVEEPTPEPSPELSFPPRPEVVEGEEEAEIGELDQVEEPGEVELELEEGEPVELEELEGEAVDVEEVGDDGVYDLQDDDVAGTFESEEDQELEIFDTDEDLEGEIYEFEEHIEEDENLSELELVAKTSTEEEGLAPSGEEDEFELEATAFDSGGEAPEMEELELESLAMVPPVAVEEEQPSEAEVAEEVVVEQVEDDDDFDFDDHEEEAGEVSPAPVEEAQDFDFDDHEEDIAPAPLATGSAAKDQEFNFDEHEDEVAVVAAGGLATEGVEHDFDFDDHEDEPAAATLETVLAGEGVFDFGGHEDDFAEAAVEAVIADNDDFDFDDYEDEMTEIAALTASDSLDISTKAEQASREAVEKLVGEVVNAEQLQKVVQAAVEKVVWDTVPALAEKMIAEAIEKLKEPPK